MDETLELVFDTLKKGKQALVFTNTKSSAEKTAEDISLQIKEVLKVNQDLADKVSKILPRPTKQCQRLALCLKKGIAFHHAGLAHKQKELIEENFKKGVIKIICCTPTLAWGLDLPAYRVILKDLRRFGAQGLNWIPTLDYLQMAGRAGRPSYDTVGEAIAIAKTDIANKEIYKRYITGEPEDIISKLAVEPVLRTYVLSLIATGFVSTEKEILDFFSKTFWAHQYQDMDKLSEIVQRMLGLLEEYKFIISSEQKEDFQSASNLIDYRYKPTLIGKRVAELYIDPLTANYLIKCVERAAKTTINEFSFLQVVSNTLEMRPLLRVGVKDHDKVHKLFTPNHSDYCLWTCKDADEKKGAAKMDGGKLCLR